MPRHELAIASNISNAIHCIHKSNVKLHELDVYSQHIVVIYLPYLCKSFLGTGLLCYAAVLIKFTYYAQE